MSDCRTHKASILGPGNLLKVNKKDINVVNDVLLVCLSLFNFMFNLEQVLHIALLFPFFELVNAG